MVILAGTAIPCPAGLAGDGGVLAGCFMFSLTRLTAVSEFIYFNF